MNSDERNCTCNFDFGWLDNEWTIGNNELTEYKSRAYSNLKGESSKLMKVHPNLYTEYLVYVLRKESRRNKQWE